MRNDPMGPRPWPETYDGIPLPEGWSFARVTAVDRSSYVIRSEAGESTAELTGKLSYQAESTADLPCVGDWVVVQFYDDGALAVIHEVLPRKTFLRRKAPGARAEFQMIAANIDIAFIVQSCSYDFNPRRLDRYLVMAADGGVEPVILLTKADLVPKDELEQKLQAVSIETRARVLSMSNLTGAGLDELRQMLSPGKTYCLLGSSGVGKTTLINNLMGREAFDTKTVSGTGEGRHTTTRRQLILLDGGAMLIDTPGMRELGLLGADDGVAGGFADVESYSAACRFADCTHEREPGCAVRAAVESGDLSEERYASYFKLKKESDFYGMSYEEKRKKDKAFGRFIKTVKEQLKG